MGYYTCYSLELENASETDRDGVVAKLKELDVIGYALDEDLGFYDSAKWYDHDADMIEVSVAFPHVHFILSGEGEDREDTWECHYLNGMFQELHPTLLWPKINPYGWVKHPKTKELVGEDIEIGEDELGAFLIGV